MLLLVVAGDAIRTILVHVGDGVAGDAIRTILVHVGDGGGG